MRNSSGLTYDFVLQPEEQRDEDLCPAIAVQVAIQLSEKDVIRAHARDELGIDMDELSNPWAAAGASAVAFVFGAGEWPGALLNPARHTLGAGPIEDSAPAKGSSGRRLSQCLVASCLVRPSALAPRLMRALRIMPAHKHGTMLQAYLSWRRLSSPATRPG